MNKIKHGKEAVEARAKLMQEIHLSGINGQRRQQADQIEEYGPTDFWVAYKVYLAKLDEHDRNPYFESAVICFHKFKETGPVSDLESEIEDLKDRIIDLEEKLEAEKPTLPVVEITGPTMLRMSNEVTTAAYTGELKTLADMFVLDLARVHLKEVRTGGRPVNEILLKVT
ncbi:MAG: hypothetical protein GY841_23525 [FCB group bacterium]|nr:hypothetical protein [FCB group bacterium]